VPQLQYKEVREIEDSSGDDLELAKKLFCMIFKEELRERPDKVCCTEAKDKVKLNQDYLKGIRCKLKLWTIGQLLLLYIKVCVLQNGFCSSADHIHYRYFYPAENAPGSQREVKRWKEIIGKLNDRIRYERRKN